MKRLAATLILSALLAPRPGENAALRPPAGCPSAQAAAEGAAILSRLPIVFVENQGQWEFPARYLWRGGPMTVFLEEAGWTFTLVERTGEGEKGASFAPAPAEGPSPVRERGVAVAMRFAGACGEAYLVPEDLASGVHNYFLGNDPARRGGWAACSRREASIRATSSSTEPAT